MSEYCEIQSQLSPKVPRKILKFVNILKRLDGIEEIILHGSRNNGEPRTDSDWDLGIICKRGLTAGEIDRYLRNKKISVERIGKLNIHGMVFYEDEIELFEKKGRVTGHPMKRILMSNMLAYGKQL